MPSIPQAFFSLRQRISFCTSQGLTLTRDCRPRLWTNLEYEPPLAVHDFPHTSHEIPCVYGTRRFTILTDFVSESYHEPLNPAHTLAHYP